MKYFEKICPIRSPLSGDKFAYCVGDMCSFYAEYASSCSIPVIANILADSDICKNVWESDNKVEEL